MDTQTPDLVTGVREAPARARAMARYLAIWAAALAVILGCVVGICVLADPYAVIGTPRIAGLNANKPAAADWPRVTKAYMVQRADPVTLIMGNSTADVGFNPDSPAWPARDKPVFNLAIDGGLPRTHLRYLQHALSVTHPAHVIIAVNFIESLVLPPKRDSAAAQDQFAFESRMLVRADGTPNPDYAMGHLADLVFATLSFPALSDSFETFLGQSTRDATYETASGWNNGGKFHRWAREDGFYALFMNKERSKIPEWLRWRAHKAVDIAPVLSMVQLAQAHRADITVVIVPNHAEEMEALRALGLDPDYDSWKTEIVERIAKTMPDAAVWDFSGYSPYTTEQVPKAGDHTTQLHWFWEPVHFQAALGDLMIARMNGKGPQGFGVRLTPANLPGQIAAFHAGEAAWMTTHPADVARIARIIQEQPK
jgi:hypothetical protein